MSFNLSPWARHALKLLGTHGRYAPSAYANRTGCEYLASCRPPLAEKVEGAFSTYALTDAGRAEFKRRHAREAVQ